MKVRVWDLPTRIFHWMLVCAYAGAFFTSDTEWFLEYHTIAGYTALGLVGFRVLWGFSGNHYARFTEFIKGWSEVKGFLRSAIKLKPPRYLGHNPAVGWVVVFMLLMTLSITATGIITYGGEENRGILAGLFSYNTAEYTRAVHSFLTDLAIAVIVVHVSAALFHDFILKENIILSMITGTKEDPQSWSERVSHMAPDKGHPAVKLVVWVIVAVMGGFGLAYLPPEGGKRDFSGNEMVKVLDERGFVVKLKPNDTWKAECASSCHSAFHPTLLPSESWKKIVSGLNDHFGDDVTLDEPARKEILDYLTASSAEHSPTEASRKLLRSIEPGTVPIRITDLPYWKDKHSYISGDVYRRKSVVSKSNCLACHPGSEAGSFEDKDISIPQ